MIIIVDAYNLLHAMPSYKKTLTDAERVRFIKQLGAYGKRKGHKMIVVFDGGQFEWPNKEKSYSVYVVYSGVNESADDYIKEYLERYRAQDLLLVSSDSELARCADRFSIPSIDSVAFYAVLKEALQAGQQTSQSAESVVKTTQETDYDIDALMSSATVVPEKSEDFLQKGRSPKSKQVGKNERALLKKLHKL